MRKLLAVDHSEYSAEAIKEVAIRPLADQISGIGEIPEQLNGHWNVIADNLNREIAQHDVRVLRFTDLHEHEFKGALEVRLPTLTEIFNHLYERETGSPPSEEDARSAEGFARDLIERLAKALRKDKLGRQLPSLVIRSGLHAAVRRNRKKLTGNDLHDFGHATAALAYCDYFATEKFLRHLVVNELKFDRRYDTIVIAEASEFLALLERIQRHPEVFIYFPSSQSRYYGSLKQQRVAGSKCFDRRTRELVESHELKREGPEADKAGLPIRAPQQRG